MNGFTINFILSRRQLQQYQAQYARKFRSVVAWPTLWFTVLLLVMGVYFFAQKVTTGKEGSDPLIFFCFSVPAAYALMLFIARVRAGKTYDTNPRLHKPIDYTFNEQFVKMKGENFETSYPWPDVLKLKITKEFVVLFVSAYTAVVIPAEHITDDEVTFIKQQFAASRKKGK